MSQVARESEVHGGANQEAELPYTWLEDYVERLEGKEARLAYYEHYLSPTYYPEAA